VGKLYPWGNKPPNGTQCNFADKNTDFDFSDRNIDDGYKYTAPVDSYFPNGYGLYNMVGNVWEWCADWYDENYYANSPKRNPTGPTSGETRVVRGGAWNWNISTMRIASRTPNQPTYTYNNTGFRCAEDVTP
jgi:sulfatase modifying factor 1